MCSNWKPHLKFFWNFKLQSWLGHSAWKTELLHWSVMPRSCSCTRVRALQLSSLIKNRYHLKWLSAAFNLSRTYNPIGHISDVNLIITGLKFGELDLLSNWSHISNVDLIIIGLKFGGISCKEAFVLNCRVFYLDPYLQESSNFLWCKVSSL